MSRLFTFPDMLAVFAAAIVVQPVIGIDWLAVEHATIVACTGVGSGGGTTKAAQGAKITAKLRTACFGGSVLSQV